MVHLIVMTQGTDHELTQAEKFFAAADGWHRLEPGVWIVATEIAAAQWRDFLTKHLPETCFLIASLSGTWATSRGMKTAAEWLRGSREWF